MVEYLLVSDEARISYFFSFIPIYLFVIGEKSFIPTYRFVRGEKKSFTYEVVLKRVFSKKNNP
jgi:hypothetical protein